VRVSLVFLPGYEDVGRVPAHGDGVDVNRAAVGQGEGGPDFRVVPVLPRPGGLWWVPRVRQATIPESRNTWLLVTSPKSLEAAAPTRTREGEDGGFTVGALNRVLFSPYHELIRATGVRVIGGYINV
jgi:hypothetical protein